MPLEEMNRTDEFNARYRVLGEEPFITAERAVTGCDYGANSHTTKDEALFLATRLGLRPGKTLLDIGAGAGWPGVYMAANTGAKLVATDLARDGLARAQKRMLADRVTGWTVITGGELLPFRDRAFDAITSSDVFC